MLVAHDPIERLRHLSHGEAFYQFYLQNMANPEVHYLVHLTSVDHAFVMGVPPSAEKWEPIIAAACTRLGLV